MKNLLLLAALSSAIVYADEPTRPVKPKVGGSTAPIEHKKDPQQKDANPTTGIISNSASGTAATGQVDANNVDKDIQQRALVALSTGTIGTQGVIATNQLTDIKVTVTNRQVTLRGDVTSEKSKATIGKRIAGLDGVKGVQNLLTINPKAKPAQADLVAPDGYSPGTGKGR